jgi:hypothetical protein
MTTTLYATYDGHVFTPDGFVDLEHNQRYLIRIESQPKPNIKSKTTILQRMKGRAKDLGISDLAAQHDHYLYGTEKQ